MFKVKAPSDKKSSAAIDLKTVWKLLIQRLKSFIEKRNLYTLLLIWFQKQALYSRASTKNHTCEREITGREQNNCSAGFLDAIQALLKPDTVDLNINYTEIFQRNYISYLVMHCSLIVACYLWEWILKNWRKLLLMFHMAVCWDPSCIYCTREICLILNKLPW